MFHFHCGKIQRIPVLWISSATRIIPVASVTRRELHAVLNPRNSERSSADELDRLSFLDVGILAKEK